MSTDESFVYDGFDMSDPEIKGWDGQGRVLVPEGDYVFEVTACAVDNTKNGDGKNFVVDYKIVGPEDSASLGETMRAWYLCNGPKFGLANKKRIIHVFRDSLRVALNTNGGFDTKDTIGCRMWGTVTHSTTSKYVSDLGNGQGGEKSYTNANISCERPTEDAPKAAPKAPAAPPKAPTAPPSRPPAAPARAR